MFEVLHLSLKQGNESDSYSSWKVVVIATVSWAQKRKTSTKISIRKNIGDFYSVRVSVNCIASPEACLNARNSMQSSYLHCKARGLFTQTSLVAQFNAIFVALKLYQTCSKIRRNSGGKIIGGVSTLRQNCNGLSNENSLCKHALSVIRPWTTGPDVLNRFCKRFAFSTRL